MSSEVIQSVCFVGAGNMGCYNAVKAAISGFDVMLYDLSEDNLGQAPGRCEGFAAYLAANGYCSADDITAAMNRMQCIADLEAATHDADLVSESVFERLDIKREVHAELDRVCPPKTILTTNSSYLPLSDIEDVVGRGDRFAAMHSYMGSPLVDIVASGRTSTETIAALQAYVESINGVPLVLKKEFPGYVLNAVLGPVLATAMLLLIEQRGSVEEIDRAWMHSRSAPMGPLGILDIIGLNLVFDSWENRLDEGPVPGLRPRVLSLLKPHVDRREYGMSTGKGFYHYPGPAYEAPDFMHRQQARSDLYQPLMVAFVACAVRVAAAGVADPLDIDRAWTVGTGLDAGPFSLLDDMGYAGFIEAFKQHVAAGWFNPEYAAMVNQYFADNTQGKKGRGA